MADGIINQAINKFQSAADLIPNDIVQGHSDNMYLNSGENIYNTSNSVKDYHTTANADLSNRISNKIGENYGNLAQAGYNVASPLASVPMSFAYDGKQAYDRMEPNSGIMGFGKAFLDESPFSAAYQRALGAADPFFNQFGMTTVKDNSLESNLSPTNINITDLLQQDVNKDIYNGYRPDQPRSFRSMTQDQNIYEPEKLSLFQRGKDLASSGIGKAGKLGMDAFNMLKNNNPMGLISSGLGGLTNMLGGMFEDKQLYADTYDEFGNKYTADQLNSMNARGGYYTDPARASRRRQNSIYRMEKRKADGKTYGKNRLETLRAIEQKAQEARDKATADKVAAFQQQRANETGAGSWGTGDEANTFGENIGSGGWDSYT